jgi:hypothetical protein
MNYCISLYFVILSVIIDIKRQWDMDFWSPFVCNLLTKYYHHSTALDSVPWSCDTGSGMSMKLADLGMNIHI